MESDEISIKELLSQAGKHLRHEFEEIKKCNPHFGERGAEAECILIDFLNNHLPKRFFSDTGFVIDNDDRISKQIDVIVYDALSSPIYRKGPKISILPCDNVAVAIEVKTNLNKQQLRDASKKISSVKKLKKTAISPQGVSESHVRFEMANTLGVVFAYDSETSLGTLSENLTEINNDYPSSEWIDLVVVLDKGVISYNIQFPFDSAPIGWFGGTCSNEFSIPPYYIHLAKAELGELTLNRFFLSLISHLTFYRKITPLNFDTVLGQRKPASEVSIPHGYPHPKVIEGAQYHYELTQCEGYEDLIDRVIVDWGQSTRAWHQWLSSKSPKEVVEILPAGYVKEFPGFLELSLDFGELTEIINNHDANREWHLLLSSVAGVYLILDTKTGKQYVGSAYGTDGILGRWRTYVKSGHGGNILLKELFNKDDNYSKYFRFSILHTLNKSMTQDDVLKWEVRFKEKLGSRAYGLNSN